MMFTPPLTLLGSSLVDTVTVDDENLAQTLDAASAIGFAIGGAVALAAIFLAFDMVRRIRRTRYREEIRSEIAQELKERPEFVADDPTG